MSEGRGEERLLQGIRVTCETVSSNMRRGCGDEMYVPLAWRTIIFGYPHLLTPHSSAPQTPQHRCPPASALTAEDPPPKRR